MEKIELRYRKRQHHLMASHDKLSSQSELFLQAALAKRTKTSISKCSKNRFIKDQINFHEDRVELIS